MDADNGHLVGAHSSAPLLSSPSAFIRVLSAFPSPYSPPHTGQSGLRFTGYFRNSISSAS
jgi:hypothetical protein